MRRAARFLPVGALPVALCLLAAPAQADAPAWQSGKGNPAVQCLATYQSIHKPAVYAFSAASGDGRMAWAVTGDEAGLHIIACLDGNVDEGVELGPQGADLGKEVRVGLIAQAGRLLAEAVAKGTLGAAQAGIYRTATGEIAQTAGPPLDRLLAFMKQRDPHFLDGRPRFATPVVD